MKKINSKNRTRSFSRRLVLVCLISSLLTIFLFSSVVYYLVSDIFLQEAIKNSHNSVVMSSENLSTYIEATKSKANTFSSEPELLRFLKNSKHDKQVVQKEIDNIIKNDSLLKTIAVVSKDGRIVSNDPNIAMSLSDDMMQEEWYKDAIKAKMPVLTGARIQNACCWVISLSVEITENGENLGVLLFDLDYSLVEKFMGQLELGERGALFIINEKFAPVYHTKIRFVENEMDQKMLIDLVNKGDFYESRSNLLHEQVKIKNSDWTVHGIFSLDGLNILKRQLLIAVIFISAILTLVSLIISFVFTENLKKPMNKLISEMDSIEKLSLIQIGRNDYREVKLLGKKYNEMILRIKKLLEDLKSNEEQLKKAEISALVSQINPHFLYNTLDTIVWMAEFNEKEKVIELTKALASFFRLSLSRGSNEISLDDEVNHVKEYLFIQKQRYEDKLNYKISNDLKNSEFIVPKIVLQPLVENALYHGIKNQGGLSIDIELHEDESNIYLDVSDDGKENEWIGNNWLSCEEFLKLVASKGIKSGAKSGSVGMRNVDERIRLYFKGQSGLFVKENKGFCARIKISKQT